MASAEPEIAACRLDLADLRRQRDRYRRLGIHLEAIERSPEVLSVHFAAGLDEALLQETIEVERGCCRFFRFEYSGSERRLRVSVERPDQVDALGAIAHALADSARIRDPDRFRRPWPLRMVAAQHRPLSGAPSMTYGVDTIEGVTRRLLRGRPQPGAPAG